MSYLSRIFASAYRLLLPGPLFCGGDGMARDNTGVQRRRD